MKTNLSPKLFLAILLSLLFVTPALAETKDTKDTKTATSAQLATISSSCNSYRTSLKNLQRADSRARIYFGAIYETVSSKYLTPLNLRLVKNDLSEPNLISAQTKLASLRSDFSTNFITYSKSLEDLIAIDCRLNPGDFYTQLQKTRAERKKVAKNVADLNSLLSSLPKLITTLSDSLPAETQQEDAISHD